jgi:hypothetical protein
MHRLAWLVVIAACSHSAPPPQSGANAPSTCDKVADHLVSLMSAKSVATDEELDPYRRVIATRCEQDLWTAKAQQCFLDTKTLQDGDACQAQLTETQQKALLRDGNAQVDQNAGQAAPAAAAPPPAEQAAPPPSPAKRSTRAPRPGDPCEGGE